MAQELRKVVIVNTADQGGGAERVSLTVLNGFLGLGLDAWLVVGCKTGDQPRVVAFHSSPFFDYQPYADSFVVHELERRRRVDRLLGLEDFNHPYSHRIAEMTGSPPDLVLCHNLHGGYFDLRVLSRLSARMPVALRLFDAWLQTGHCAYSLGCTRWRAGCGECPDLAIPPAIARDSSTINLRRKQRVYRDSRLFVSAETRWMLERARQSVLAPSVVDWRHIPGAVDLETFSPGTRDEARRGLGIGLEAKVLLYAANQGASNPYKDFETVRVAVRQLSNLLPGRRVHLLVVGSHAPDEQIGPHITVRHAGRVAAASELARYYRAADLLIHSAVEETFGNVVAESLACGTPVVAASGGGVVELIEDGVTGLVLPPRAPAELATAISTLLKDTERCTRMGAAAAAAARQQFDSRTMIGNLRAWCAEIHAMWHDKAAH